MKYLKVAGSFLLGISLFAIIILLSHIVMLLTTFKFLLELSN